MTQRERLINVGFDMQSAVGAKTGIGYYASCLFGCLREKHKDLHVEALRKDTAGEMNTVQRMIWENVNVPLAARRNKVDILHIPGFAGPLFCGGIRKVTTVCDLIGMIFPENLGRISRSYWGEWLPMCVKNSDRILAISECTKNDIMRFLKIPEEKIKVIYLACSERFRPLTDGAALERVRLHYGLPERFCLNLGTIEPRKNVEGLIRAFDLYVKKYGSGLKLVIAGKKGWAYENVLKRVRDNGLEEKVMFMDYVDDKDLPSLYNLAEFFIYPSFYEGFGLPVLEALACARPVICSNVSSLPEVAGEAALMVDPEDIDDIADAIKSLASDPGLREELSGKALFQAGKFSWEKTASDTAQVYREILP